MTLRQELEVGWEFSIRELDNLSKEKKRLEEKIDSIEIEIEARYKVLAVTLEKIDSLLEDF